MTINDRELQSISSDPSTYRWADANLGVLWMDAPAHDGYPFRFDAKAYFANEVERDVFIASLPKSLRLRPGTSTGPDGTRFTAGTQVQLSADGVNGGTNETGLRRYEAILKASAKTGAAIGWVTIYSNSIKSRAEFEALVGLR